MNICKCLFQAHMEMVTIDLIPQFVQGRRWTIKSSYAAIYNVDLAHIGPTVVVFNVVFLIPIFMIKQTLWEALQWQNWIRSFPPLKEFTRLEASQGQEVCSSLKIWFVPRFLAQFLAQHNRCSAISVEWASWRDRHVFF